MQSQSNPVLEYLNDWLMILDQPKTLIVAFSGGLDSSVLLHSLWQLIEGNKEYSGISLKALHINHNLSDDSWHWSNSAQKFCHGLNISFKAIAVQVDGRNALGMEAAARAARYRAFELELNPGDYLLQAHHQNDQAETLLLRLLRGAGSKGLASIPKKRQLGAGFIFRPFLDIPRIQLISYAKEFHLTWVEDPSNYQDQYDRSYLRHTVLPLLLHRWPSTINIFSRNASLCAQQNELLDEYLKHDFDQVSAVNHKALSLKRLLKTSDIRQKAIFRYYLRFSGLALPEKKQLDLVIKSLSCHRQGIIGQWGQVRVYCNETLVLAHQKPKPFDTTVTYRWQGGPALQLPQGSSLKLVTLEKTLNVEKMLAHPLLIKFRQGGEVIQRRQMNKSVKKYFQEQRVLPWWRDRIPLIYFQDQLVAIANWWCADWFGDWLGEQGVKLDWQITDLVRLSEH